MKAWNIYLTIAISAVFILSIVVAQESEKILVVRDIDKEKPPIEPQIEPQIERQTVSLILTFSEKPRDYKEFLRPLGNITRDYSIINGLAIKISPSALGALSKAGNLTGIYMDREVHAFLNESVPLISAPDVWATGFNGSGIKVCVVDTGIDYTHPALVGKVVAQYDFYNNDADAMDDNGHGTHVAGIIASQNATYKGVAPGASLMAAKVLSATGSGSTSNIIAGIEWCVNNGANITSLSLGTGIYWYRDSCDDMPDSQAVNNAVKNGTVVVVAAGNDNDMQRGISSPGCASRAITVGATRKSDAIEHWSSRGEELDVSAPGISIKSTVPNGTCQLCDPTGFRTLSGTSMATPHVSGMAALVLQSSAIIPAATKHMIQNTVLDFGVESWDIPYGFGRINSSAAFYATSTIPKIGLQKNRSKYSNMVGESITITINITNYGEDALNVNVTDNISSGLNIISGSNSAFYSTIPKGESRILSYIVNGSEGEYYLGEATTTYSDGVNTYTSESNKPSLRVWKNKITDTVTFSSPTKDLAVSLSGWKDFTARVEWDNPNRDLDLYLYSPSGGYAADFSWWGGSDEEVWFSNAAPGTWTLRVNWYNRVVGQSQTFNLYYSEYTPKSYTATQDAGFESGDVGSSEQKLWQETEFRDTGYEIFSGVAGFSPHSGRHHAEISYVNNRVGSATTRATSYGQISQSINLSGCAEANLTAWVSSPNSPASNYFNYSVMVFNGTENVLWERRDSDGSFGWMKTNFNISKFCGQTADVIFRMKNVYGDITTTTERRFWVDDVSVSLTYPQQKIISTTLIGYPVDFGNQNPGIGNVSALGNAANQYVIRVNPETNVNVNISQKGDDYASGGSVMGIENMTWSTTNNVTTSQKIRKVYDAVATNVLPGTDINMYYWLSIPSLGSGVYSAALYIYTTEA